jgi:hypothetical protein
MITGPLTVCNTNDVQLLSLIFVSEILGTIVKFWQSVDGEVDPSTPVQSHKQDTRLDHVDASPARRRNFCRRGAHSHRTELCHPQSLFQNGNGMRCCQADAPALMMHHINELDHSRRGSAGRVCTIHDRTQE